MLLTNLNQVLLLPEVLQWNMRVEWTCRSCSLCEREDWREQTTGGQGGPCNETEDSKGQGVRGKAVAGDGGGLGAPRDGNYGS